MRHRSKLPSENAAARSLGMVYRTLYYVANTSHRGAATHPIAYLAAHVVSLGVLKRTRNLVALGVPTAT